MVIFKYCRYCLNVGLKMSKTTYYAHLNFMLWIERVEMIQIIYSNPHIKIT